MDWLDKLIWGHGSFAGIVAMTMTILESVVLKKIRDRKKKENPDLNILKTWKTYALVGLMILVTGFSAFAAMSLQNSLRNEKIRNHVRQCIFYMKLNPPEWDNALIEVSQAADLDIKGTYTDVYHNAAICHMSKKPPDYKKAEENLEKVLRVEPNKTLSLFTRGALYARTNRTKNALDDLEKSIECCKNNREYNFIKENVSEEYGDHKDAPEDLRDNPIYKGLLRRLETSTTGPNERLE